MHRPTCLVLFFVALFAQSINSSASLFEQFVDPMDGAFDTSQWLTDNAYGFLPVPILIPNPH